MPWMNDSPVPSTGGGWIPAQNGWQPTSPADIDALIRREAASQGLDPEQALTLSRFEDPTRSPTTTSPAGAYGPMQVMPFKDRGDVKSVGSNIRKGLELWKDALRQYKTPQAAYALGYNPGFKGKGPFGEYVVPMAPPVPQRPIQPAPQPLPAPIPQNPQMAGPQLVQQPSGHGIGGMLGRTGLWTQQHILHPLGELGGLIQENITGPKGVYYEPSQPGQEGMAEPTERGRKALDVLTNIISPAGVPAVGAEAAAALVPGVIQQGAAAAEKLLPKKTIITLPGTPLETPLPTPRRPPKGILPRPPVTPILQARKADEAVRAINAEQAARQASHLSFLQGSEYQALTSAQKSELFHLLHSPQSPLLTGQWPVYTTPRMRQTLTEGMQELRRDYLAIKGLSPEAQELLLGKQVEDPTSVYFPRQSLTHAIEEKKLGGLGARRIKKSAGSLQPRKLPQELTEAEKQHQYIQDPFLTLFDAQNEMQVARQTREMMEQWKTDPEFKNIVSAPGEPHPEGWRRAPWLGNDFYVEPHLSKVADRIRGMRFGDPGRYRVLNNWSLNVSFGLWPFAHHRNLIYNYLVATRGIVRPDLFAEATREVNGFGEKYIRFLELGGGTQFLDVRRQKMLAQIIRQTAQDPAFKRVGTGLLERYWNWQHSVTWKFDAVLNMQSVLYLTKRGMPFDEAARLVTQRIPNYYLPSFFTGPKALQGLADLTHDAVTRSSWFIFAPYHYGLAKGLQRALGPKSWDMLAAILIADQVVWPRMIEPALQKAGAEYYRRRGDKFNERRWSRVHVTQPGYGRVVEGLKAGLGQELGVLRAAPKGRKIAEGARELGPAVGTMGRTLLTVSPLGRAAADVFSLLSGGGTPDFSQLVPFGTPQEAYKVLTGKTPPLEAAGSFAGVYPRYYMPLEYQAAQVKQELPHISSQVYSLRKSGQIQQANMLVENTSAHLYTLYLAAARDLQAHGFKLPSTPEAFAHMETQADMLRTGLGLTKSPSIRPARPTPKKVTIPKPGQPTLVP